MSQQRNSKDLQLTQNVTASGATSLPDRSVGSVFAVRRWEPFNPVLGYQFLEAIDRFRLGGRDQMHFGSGGSGPQLDRFQNPAVSF